jgi:hypothetical protein
MFMILEEDVYEIEKHFSLFDLCDAGWLYKYESAE